MERTKQEVIDQMQQDEDFYLHILLSRTHHMLSKLRDIELTHEYNILPTQSYFLWVIQVLGEATPSEITKFVYQEKSSVSDILKRMQKNGLITKSKAKGRNGRVLIKLSEKGEKIYKLSSKRDSIHLVLSTFTKEQKRQLIDSLEMLRYNIAKELTINSIGDLAHYYNQKEDKL